MDVTASPPERAMGPYIPLFWRLLVPNAAVLVAACIILIVEPANGRIVALVGGLLVMLVVNAILMRRTFAPLARLTGLMDAIDPLAPGQRLPPLAPNSEVTLVAHSLNEMLDRVESERRESARRALRDQENERQHLAAELHDEIGQNVTALIMQLDRLARRVPEPCRPEVADAAVTARESLEAMRSLARRLRPEVLDELGLLPALKNLCDRLSHQTGLRIDCSLPNTPPGPLGRDVELVIYRVAQESLTNFVRHAKGTRANLEIGEDDNAITLSIGDDGIGLPDESASDGGVRAMRERALLIGGQLTLGTSPLGGALVSLRVPGGGRP